VEFAEEGAGGIRRQGGSEVAVEEVLEEAVEEAYCLAVSAFCGVGIVSGGREVAALEFLERGPEIRRAAPGRLESRSHISGCR
jgi:hypothetical protein